jgi:anaphase-promoting complex subunit 3
MAPSVPHIAHQLRQLIYYQLDNNLLRNALFLAQRLVAYEPRSAEAAYLLALCQYQSGFVKGAWDTSRSFAHRGSHLGCAYVFAQACLELTKFVDGINALEKCRHLWQNRNSWNQHTESRRQHLPDAAAVLCLKGKLWKAHKNLDQAVECWAASLKLNPFMWDAYLNLCDAGAKVSVPNIYKASPEMLAAAQSAHAQSQKSENAPHPPPDKSSTASLPLQAQTTNHNTQNSSDPFAHNSKSGHGSTVLWEKFNGSKTSINTVSTILDEESMNTPSTIVDTDQVVYTVNEPPAAPVRKPRSIADSDGSSRFKGGLTRGKMRSKASEEASILPDPAPPVAPSKRTISGQVASSSHMNGGEGTRRSNRLLSNRPPSASGNPTSKPSLVSTLGIKDARDIKKTRAPMVKGRTANTSTVGRVVSGNRTRTGSADAMDVDGKEHRKEAIPPVPSIPNHKVREPLVNRELEALNTLLDLMARLSSAQLSLSNYDSQGAIQSYNNLPSAHRETPFVLAQIGKAYYEQASYADADKFFQRVRQIAPSRLEDMEIYSTVLWHLKSDIELAYLAHSLIEIDRLSPQAWCAVGNSFSLQREHEQALRCFKRATQLDPQFAYGFTLQGHEHVANEEFEKALESYRCAISADGRHYNAWYGLGKVYEKMGKWAIAEQHYRTAAKINPTNAVLICCIGMVLEKLKQPDVALQMYTRACNLSPSSALSRFKKARCLMTLSRPQEALAELEILRDVAPEEANVWFLMGRLCKMLGRKGEAVRAFTVALNLDPKVCLILEFD